MKKLLVTMVTALAIAGFTQCTPNIPTEPEKHMSATLSQPEVSLPYSSPVNVTYTLTDVSGNVSVTVEGLPTGIIYKNKISGAEEGNIELTSSLDENKDIDALVVFTDQKTTIKKDLKIHTAEKIVPMSASVELPSEVIYPAECNTGLDVPFTIVSKSAVDEVTVETGEGLEASLDLASDMKSGTIKIKAKAELGTSANVMLKVKSGTEETSKSFSLVKAFLTVDHDSFNVASSGTASQYTLNISTNLNVDVKVTDKDGIINSSFSAGTLNFTVAENTTMTQRFATIDISEPLGKLNRSVLITQSGLDGDNASDRAALIALYDALNMKEWIDYGCGGENGYYYKYWCTDVPMDHWSGVGMTGKNGTGRVWYVHLLGEQPKSTGYIPEELGQLTKLKEFTMYPNHKITHLPESIRNLVNLTEFRLSMCNMEDIDLASWKGLAELMNNPNKKLYDLSFYCTKFHGTIPEWLTALPDKGNFDIVGCHFSGQVPDKVASAGFWTKMSAFEADLLEACPRFDKTKYQTTEDGWYYKVPQGEGLMYLQADNYALWVGERPSNTKWVDDNLGGHWEWTD